MAYKLFLSLISGILFFSQSAISGDGSGTGLPSTAVELDRDAWGLGQIYSLNGLEYINAAAIEVLNSTSSESGVFTFDALSFLNKEKTAIYFKNKDKNFEIGSIVLPKLNEKETQLSFSHQLKLLETSSYKEFIRGLSMNKKNSSITIEALEYLNDKIQSGKIKNTKVIEKKEKWVIEIEYPSDK